MFRQLLTGRKEDTRGAGTQLHSCSPPAQSGRRAAASGQAAGFGLVSANDKIVLFHSFFVCEVAIMPFSAREDCLPKTPQTLPVSEYELRLARCRMLLAKYRPEVDGLLLADKVHIFYLTGTLGTGLFWLPLQGEPVLMLRKGTERAAMESPVQHILPFVSYRELPFLTASVDSPLGDVLAVDKNKFSWNMAEMLQKRLPGLRFVAADEVMNRARAVKSAWEQEKMRVCGGIHAKVYDEILPELFHTGLSEQELAFLYLTEVMKQGSEGMCRMHAHGEEMFFGYASIGNDGLYPTSYNGPLGCRGLHPAIPFLGSREVVWHKHQCLALDMGCVKNGYHTDRTQIYWSGRADAIPHAMQRAQSICKEILCTALDMLRPGVTPAELWRTALDIAGKHNVLESFMGLGRDQVPFLGHSIGLCLDEWPAIAKSFNEPLEEGMTIALEPKISVPGIGMPGIEHTYLVCSDGPVPLTGTQMDIVCID